MLLNRFFKKKTVYEDPDEVKFDKMMELIKDLDRKAYNKLKKAMDLGYDAYQIVRDVKTLEEEAIEKQIKENADIDIAEKILEEK